MSHAEYLEWKSQRDADAELKALLHRTDRTESLDGVAVAKLMLKASELDCMWISFNAVDDLDAEQMARFFTFAREHPELEARFKRSIPTMMASSAFRMTPEQFEVLLEFCSPNEIGPRLLQPMLGKNTRWTPRQVRKLREVCNMFAPIP